MANRSLSYSTQSTLLTGHVLRR